LGKGGIINPKIPKLDFYPQSVADNVPKMYNTLMYVWIGIWIFAVLLVHENPEVKINKQRNAGKGNTTAPPENKVKVKEALTSKSFWIIWFMCLFGVAFGLWISGLFKAFNTHLPASVLNTAGQLGFIFNAVGRVSFGALSDKIGFKKTYLIVMVL
jgi:nitrate/nitrite transporter NarK